MTAPKLYVRTFIKEHITQSRPGGPRYYVRAHTRDVRVKRFPYAPEPLAISDDELTARYARGEGYCAIAQTLGATPRAVRERLVGLGIAIRGPGRPKGHRNRKPYSRRNAERDAEIAGLYALGETCAELAEAYGLSVERVAQICRRAGVIRGRGKRRKQ